MNSVYYGNGLDAFIEAIYLQEEIDPSVGSLIHVNPKNPTYITGKIVIINTADYSMDKIMTLVRNKCKVISRTSEPGECQGVEVCPYILRPCFDVIWNGRMKEINTHAELDKFLEGDEDEWSMTFPDYKLYFPKLTIWDKKIVVDEYGNLTGLGWILQQTGVNLIEGTPFNDLDLVKTKSLLLLFFFLRHEI
jgi:hypothetical protein